MCRVKHSRNSITASLTDPAQLWSRWCSSLYVNVWHCGICFKLSFLCHVFIFFICYPCVSLIQWNCYKNTTGSYWNCSTNVWLTLNPLLWTRWWGIDVLWKWDLSGSQGGFTPWGKTEPSLKRTVRTLQNKPVLHFLFPPPSDLMLVRPLLVRCCNFSLQMSIHQHRQLLSYCCPLPAAQVITDRGWRWDLQVFPELLLLIQFPLLVPALLVCPGLTSVLFL